MTAALEGPNVQMRHGNINGNNRDYPVRPVQQDCDGRRDDGNDFRFHHFGKGGRCAGRGLASVGLARGFDQGGGVAQGFLDVPRRARAVAAMEKRDESGPAPCPGWIRSRLSRRIIRRTEMSASWA